MLLPLLAGVSAFLSLLSSSTALHHLTRQTSAACNNSPDLCSRVYSDITHLGAHDVAFLRDSSTSFSTAGNQFYNATVALSAGVRLLQAQVHAKGSVLELCHTSCDLLDGGSLENWLSDVKAWMDTNPNEVVTLLLVNSDNNSTTSIGEAFTSSGISKYGFSPASTTAPLTTWPTLQTMITADTRLVTFVASLPATDTTYPYLLSEFSYVFETPFTVTSSTGFNCTLDRPPSLASTGGAIAVTDGYLSLANHFLDTPGVILVPDVTNITTTNSPAANVSSSLGTHLGLCEAQWSKVNFVLVDFWNVESPIEAVDKLNGISGSVTGRTSVSNEILTAETANAASEGVDGAGTVGPALFVLAGIAAGNFLWL